MPIKTYWREYTATMLRILINSDLDASYSRLKYQDRVGRKCENLKDEKSYLGEEV